jgi:HSP20 family protein
METMTQNRERSWDTQDRDRGYMTPPVNISATKDEYVLEIEMPGVSKEGLEVIVENGMLTVVGRRARVQPGGELYYSESRSEDYKRMFEIAPDIDTGRIHAEMKQGVVTLRLPKSERAKPRKIAIQ